MYCSKCGREIPDNSNVCPFCGKLPREGMFLYANASVQNAFSHSAGAHYSYNSESALFHNPYNKLLALVVVLVFLTASADCALLIGLLIYVPYDAPTSLAFLFFGPSLILMLFAYTILGTVSLKHRSAKRQLTIMNIFLVLAWILLAGSLVCLVVCKPIDDADSLPMICHPPVAAILFAFLLCLTTIVKCVYAGKLKPAYDSYLREQSRYSNAARF